MREIARDHLERKSSRILGRGRCKSKTTIMEIVHKVVAKTKGSIFIAKKFQPSWSGILVIDGKGLRVFDKLAKSLDLGMFSNQQLRRLHRKVWICGIDYLTGDLPHYRLADEETKVDLVMYFKVLREEIRYKLKVLICDGNNDFVSSARKIYGNTFLVQRCTRHYLETVKLRLGRLGVLEHPRSSELLSDIKSIIQTKDLETANERLQKFKRKRFDNPAHKEIIKDFFKDTDTLTTYLQYPNIPIPHTNNDIENLFRQVSQRITGICRFGHWKYAEQYMNAWALMRRFSPFTDCRGKRKTRNRKTPLELAGCDVSNIDYLDLK